MNIPDLVGWVSNIFFILGVTMIANHNIKGFYYNIGGNFGYLIQGLILSMYSLTILSIYLIGINIYGIITWKKNNHGQ